jgi:GNAT superfamily N-acetyltransferase/rRNA-processing protein FCF1
MSSIKVLIDTNVIIGLEDAGEVKAALADFVRKAAENDIKIFVHEASKKDIERDKNLARRKSTLSRIAKFPTLKKVATPDANQLAAKYGPLPKANDVIDATLLDALANNIVNLLVTEDDGLHRRARNVGIAERVFTVAEALAWIKLTYEHEEISLPSVEAIKAYGLEKTDPIFDGLRADYPGFDDWLDKCIAEHRDCWVIRDGGALAAIVIRNDEDHSAAGTKHIGPKIMKICTFKVSDRHHGKKFGEQLLKQLLWHAQRNHYDLLYVTAFPKQKALIRLIEDYGFRRETKRKRGELVFEKPMGAGAVLPSPSESALDQARRHYPRFVDAASVRKFVIPIRHGYHHQLFPEFRPADESNSSEKPGNTIRKVYLCRAVTNQIRPGDLVFFYMSRSNSFGSQSLSSVGVVEQVRHSGDLDQVISWTAKRSVYAAAELAAMVALNSTPLKIIDFLLAGHISPVVPLDQLIDQDILRGAPQSICQLSEAQYLRLKPLTNLGFRF